MRPQTLSRILLGAIAASLASCGKVDAPRDVTSADGGSPGTDFDCSDEKSAYEALRVATGADYLELRESVEEGASTTTAQAGTVCASATDAAACEAALQKARATTGDLIACSGGCMRRITRTLVYTKGDAAGVLARPADVLAFVGAVDAPAKAWFVAETQSGTSDVSCRAGAIRESAAGYTVDATGDCGAEEVVLDVARAGAVTEVSRAKKQPSTCGCACVGRRPAGLVARRPRAAPSPLAAHFVEMSELEAASVDAFTNLRRELTAHGAPLALRRAATRSARDEVKHARMTARLARRFGGSPRRPEVRALPVRSLFEIALENSVEGCVRETYGALEATWQARAAEDPHVRAAMAVIARDETRHGALAWRVARWIEPLLSAEERRLVADARRAEVTALARRAAATEVDPDLVRRAGLPDLERAKAFAASLEATLWSAA
ncbi:MAG: ferritin-like domain-containing protein [Labilithrix sp.]|nr:ferritin-like domain-containing protein [Labilithrix sp.]MCW5813219.1 ferritin-like domain-containing protein [Labilithrix sp.]